MKDIMLKITGSTIVHQDNKDKYDDVVEFVTEGKLFHRGKTTVVSYLESEVSGMEGCKTSLSISPGRLTMKRTGDAVSMDSEMLFEKGKRYECLYNTPYGSLGIELLTNEYKGPEILSNGNTGVSVDYSMSLKGVTEVRKKLDIEIIQNN